jgi:TolB-like protein/DNA-binding winged helix-turn-helix (wHTH) protein
MLESENSLTKTFGRWTFDPGTGDLSDGDSRARLEPQVARLLDYFLKHQHRLISRDELMAEVWDQRVVSDHALNRCMSILRNTLSPDDRNAYIETVVRRGFISHFPPGDADGPAEPSDPDSISRRPSETLEQSAPKPQTGDWPEVDRRRRRSDRWKPVALLVLLFLGAVLVHQQWSAPPVPAESRAGAEAPMLAILPFLTNDESGESRFFANGMHDDLLTQLAQLHSLRVISRTSVGEYRGREMNIRQIGRQLGADAILEGGVQRIGDYIRINMQLIDAETDTHLWAEQYDRELTPANIFEVQSEIARSVAEAMHSTLTPEDVGHLSVIPTQNMAAYRAFHEAMQMRGDVTIRGPAYLAALERAVQLDPDFVRA